MFALPSTPLMAHLGAPAQYAVFDLETGDAPAGAIDAAMNGWKPPKNWKPETVDAKRAERIETMNGKAALLDASPILCLAVKTERLALILNGMDATAYEVPGWQCLPCGDERGLLLALRAILDASAGLSTPLVGHNLIGFDLPKLRNGYLRNRLKVPAALADFEQPVFDTMRQIRYFSMENAEERYVSLDTLARVLGIPQPKQVMTGADCPRLYREGRIAEVLTYCCVDVATTAHAYALMTGTAPDLE